MARPSRPPKAASIDLAFTDLEPTGGALLGGRGRGGGKSNGRADRFTRRIGGKEMRPLPLHPGKSGGGVGRW